MYNLPSKSAAAFLSATESPVSKTRHVTSHSRIHLLTGAIPSEVMLVGRILVMLVSAIPSRSQTFSAAWDHVRPLSSEALVTGLFRPEVHEAEHKAHDDGWRDVIGGQVESGCSALVHSRVGNRRHKDPRTDPEVDTDDASYRPSADARKSFGVFMLL